MKIVTIMTPENHLTMMTILTAIMNLTMITMRKTLKDNQANMIMMIMSATPMTLKP